MLLQAVRIPLLLALSLWPGFAVAQPREEMELVGTAKLNFLLWTVYEARLYSIDGTFVFPETLPFTLVLEYRRAFSSGELLAETARQWQAIGIEEQEDWINNLAGVLPDVNKSDEIALRMDVNGHSAFFLNGEPLGIITDTEFSSAFAAIWLSEKTTHPEFRNSLLGNIQ